MPSQWSPPSACAALVARPCPAVPGRCLDSHPAGRSGRLSANQTCCWPCDLTQTECRPRIGPFFVPSPEDGAGPAVPSRVLALSVATRQFPLRPLACLHGLLLCVRQGLLQLLLPSQLECARVARVPGRPLAGRGKATPAGKEAVATSAMGASLAALLYFEMLVSMPCHAPFRREPTPPLDYVAIG